MPLGKSLWGLWIGCFIAALAFGLIIWKFDPYRAHWTVFALLFISFLIFWAGVFTTLIYFWYLKLGLLDFSGLFSVSLKLGIIGSVALTVIFLLQTIHILAWWNGLMVAVIAFILGLYFKD
ncbi:MAG: hypothetical protein V1807_01550 [Patescibacteria group bacterium]